MRFLRHALPAILALLGAVGTASAAPSTASARGLATEVAETVDVTCTDCTKVMASMGTATSQYRGPKNYERSGIAELGYVAIPEAKGTTVGFTMEYPIPADFTGTEATLLLNQADRQGINIALDSFALNAPRLTVNVISPIAKADIGPKSPDDITKVEVRKGDRNPWAFQLKLDAAALEEFKGQTITLEVTTAGMADIECTDCGAPCAVASVDFETVSGGDDVAAIFQDPDAAPAWADEGVDICTLPEEGALCDWDSAYSSVSDSSACGPLGCNMFPVGGSGQVDGGFTFSGFARGSGVVLLGIRPQIRQCGLAPQINNPPEGIRLPSQSQSDATDRWGWSFDLWITSPDNDLTDTSNMLFELIFERKDGTPASYTLLLDLVAFAPSPLVLWQVSWNFGFGFLAPVYTALGWTVDDVDVEFTATLRAVDAASGDELGRSSFDAITIAARSKTDWMCTGNADPNFCNNPAVGCLPCSDAEAVGQGNCI